MRRAPAPRPPRHLRRQPRDGVAPATSSTSASPEFVFLQADIVEPYFVDEPVDVVYHLASPASPIDYLRLPLHTLKVGSHGTHHTLGLAKAHRARFLLASTSEVYGDPQVHPQTEDYWGHVNPIGPRGVYDEAKRYAEALTMAYHRQQGVDTAIVRIFNTYGAADAPARRPRDPDVPAPGPDRPADHGLRRRQPDALVLLRRRPDPRASSRWPSPASTSRSTSATPTSSRCSSWPRPSSRSPARASEIVHEALPTDDPKQSAGPTSARARDLLGWEPEVDLRDGLRARSTRPGSTPRGGDDVGRWHASAASQPRDPGRPADVDAGHGPLERDRRRARPPVAAARGRVRRPPQAPAGALVPAALGDRCGASARVGSLLALDFAGVFIAIYTALGLKAVARGLLEPEPRSLDTTKQYVSFAFLADGAALRPVGPLRRPRRAAGAVAHRRRRCSR